MSIKQLIAHSALFFVLVNPVHAVVISSTFDAGDEGWIGIPGEGSSAFFASGGNPGGHIQITDIGGGGFLGSGAIAPSKFLGDLSGFDNGTLSVDLATFAGSGTTWSTFGMVLITGVGGDCDSSSDPGTLPFCALFDLTDTVPGSTWETFSAPLTATAWGKTPLEWMTILAGVTKIEIGTDAFDSNDTTGIDNFTIRDRTTPVPVPATLWLFFSGPGGLGLIGRHCRKSNPVPR